MAHTKYRKSVKIERVARRLKIEFAHAYGLLDLLWDYAYSSPEIGPDGLLRGFDWEDIECAAIWKGDEKAFFEAITDPKVEFLKLAGDGQTWYLPEYYNLVPKFVKDRWSKDPENYGMFASEGNAKSLAAAAKRIQDAIGSVGDASETQVKSEYETKQKPIRSDPVKPNKTKPDPVRSNADEPQPTVDEQPQPASEQLEETGSLSATGPDLISDSAGSDRQESDQSENRFVQVFTVKVCCAASLSSERSLAERRSINAVGRTIAGLPNRDAVAIQLFDLAEEKAGAHLDNPMAAWQAEVNKLYPSDTLARPPT